MKDLSRYINKVPVKVELDTSMEKILAIQLLYKQVIDVIDTIEGGSIINVKSDWNAEAGSESEILHKPTKLSCFTDDVGFVKVEDTQYKNVYIGIGSEVEDIKINDNYYEAIKKSAIIPIDNADNYLWILLPSIYTPILLMSGIYIPMINDSSITEDEIEYTAWKSLDRYEGDFGIILI